MAKKKKKGESLEEAFEKHLQQKAKGLPTCPVCTVNSWSVGAQSLTFLIGPGFKLGGEHFPVVPLVCSNCGFVRLFSAMVVGLEEFLTEHEDQDSEAKS